MACDYLQLYFRAPLPPASNDRSLSKLFDWFRLLIFQPEALSDQTNKCNALLLSQIGFELIDIFSFPSAYVNVLAFLISLLSEDQPNHRICNRLDMLEHNFASSGRSSEENIREKNSK